MPESTDVRDLPDGPQFYVRTPLYEFFPVTDDNWRQLQGIVYPDDPIDAFCVYCGQSSVFHRSFPQNIGYLSEWDARRFAIFSVYISCARSSDHTYRFYFLRTNDSVGKIGQHPSLADLNTPQLGQYRKLLGDERWRELNRAVGLAAHGVGIGAFVYLRRVFESLINDAHALQSKERGWSEEEYRRARMDEKIRMLADSLPPFLVEHRELYSILSLGVHQLTEDECLRHFDTVRVGIEFILDERLETQAREKKLREASNTIRKTKGSIDG